MTLTYCWHAYWSTDNGSQIAQLKLKQQYMRCPSRGRELDPVWSHDWYTTVIRNDHHHSLSSLLISILTRTSIPTLIQLEYHGAFACIEVTPENTVALTVAVSAAVTLTDSVSQCLTTQSLSQTHTHWQSQPTTQNENQMTLGLVD